MKGSANGQVWLQLRLREPQTKKTTEHGVVAKRSPTDGEAVL